MTLEIDVLTLFPSMVTGPLAESIPGRIQDQGLAKVRVHDLREWGLGRHRSVDDTPYGGGAGMILRPEPVAAALDALRREDSTVILLDPVGEVFRQARAAGATTVLDIVLPGPGDHWSELAPVLAETDVFLPNDDEAALITGLDDPCRQAERFHSAGVGTVAITCGGRGTVLLSEGLRVKAGAYPTSYVGATGAGDAFDAGYIAGLLAGGDPLRCLEWGSALGASCVRSIGATESVFTRDEAEAFMRANRLPIERW